MPRHCCFLDLLPVELMHSLFTYFRAHEILLSFSNVSDHVDAVLLSYPCYRLDFKSILKCHFDLVCRRIRPDQVMSLRLSDADDTPGQSELFFSRFRIEQFIRLQSFTMNMIEFQLLELIFSNLNQLDNLCSLTFHSKKCKTKHPTWSFNYSNMVSRTDTFLSEIYPRVFPKCSRLSLSDGFVLKTMPLPCLRYLTLAESTIDELKIICCQAPRLRSLNVSLKGDISDLEYLCPSSQLKRLILKINSSLLSMNQMERFLPNLPYLTHFELQSKGYSDLADGYRWQMLSSGFITFNFKFQVHLNWIERTLNPFRTSFWLHEKRWYVAYDDKYLFSVPHFAPEDANTLYSPLIYTTAPDDALFYEHITKLTVLRLPSGNSSHYNHVKSLELICSISLETISLLVDLTRIQHLTLKSPVDVPSLIIFIGKMPNLHELWIDGCLNLDFTEKMRGNRFEQIRTFEFIIDSVNSTSIVEGLLPVFPCLEHLRGSFLLSRMNMIRMIDGFKHLSSASFTICSKLDEDKRQWFFEPELSIRDVQRLNKGTFTCRFSRSSPRSLLSDVHVWIGEQMNTS